MKNNKNIEKEIKSWFHSLLSSISLFAIWLLMFVFFGLTLKSYKWSDALFTSSLIYVCIVGFWTLIRFGFAESIILKMKNNKNTKVNRLDNNNKERLTIEKLRKQRSKKYWTGILLNWFISISLLIISLVFSHI